MNRFHCLLLFLLPAQLHDRICVAQTRNAKSCTARAEKDENELRKPAPAAFFVRGFRTEHRKIARQILFNQPTKLDTEITLSRGILERIFGH
ncbi:MAG: hypothetical protein ACO1NO_02490 [Burkholderiaceae bacterium]